MPVYYSPTFKQQTLNWLVNFSGKQYQFSDLLKELENRLREYTSFTSSNKSDSVSDRDVLSSGSSKLHLHPDYKPISNRNLSTSGKDEKERLKLQIDRLCRLLQQDLQKSGLETKDDNNFKRVMNAQINKEAYEAALHECKELYSLVDSGATDSISPLKYKFKNIFKNRSVPLIAWGGQMEEPAYEAAFSKSLNPLDLETGLYNRKITRDITSV